MSPDTKPEGFATKSLPADTYFTVQKYVEELQNPLVIMDYQGTIAEDFRTLIPGARGFIEYLNKNEISFYIVTGMDDEERYKELMEIALQGLIDQDNFKGVYCTSGKSKQPVFSQIEEAHKGAKLVFVGDCKEDFPNDDPDQDNCFRI